MAPPSIGLIVARWGGWPAWTPLLLLTMRANPSVDFILLSDAAPSQRLPPNVRFVDMPLDAVLARFRPLGCTLKTLRSQGTFGSGVSAAKVNDLKPLFGTAFADLLRRYEWWGYLQEDLALGDLRAFATESLLAASDVVSPYLPPLNSSGVFMLYRNVRKVTEVWRRSSAIQRVLSSSRYLVFDEWWGALASSDNLARVLGREASAGRLRLTLASAARRWMGDDKHYVGTPTPTLNEDFVACWRAGELWANVGGKRTPCAGIRPSGRRRHATGGGGGGSDGGGSGGGGSGGDDDGTGTGGVGARVPHYGPQVAIVHLSRLKRLRAYADLPSATLAPLAASASEFAMTRLGVWIPAAPTANLSVAVRSDVVRGGGRDVAGCVDDRRWANRYSLDCDGHVREGHCAGGQLSAGHEWAGAEDFGSPQEHCCACGRGRPPRREVTAHERKQRGAVTRVAAGAVSTQQAAHEGQQGWAAAQERHQARHVLISGLSTSNLLQVSSDGLGSYLVALQRRDEAARCNPRKSARCPPAPEPPKPPCVAHFGEAGAGALAGVRAGETPEGVLRMLGASRC